LCTGIAAADSPFPGGFDRFPGIGFPVTVSVTGAPPPEPWYPDSRRTVMSVQISIDLPESAFSALRVTPEAFAGELRLAAAVKWYEMGLVSQSKGAEVAGVTRHAFVEALARFGVSPFQTTTEELEDELVRE
jgi:predicted HTH domain antitoxin